MPKSPTIFENAADMIVVEGEKMYWRLVRHTHTRRIATHLFLARGVGVFDGGLCKGSESGMPCTDFRALL